MVARQVVTGLLQLPRGADKQFDPDRVPIHVTNLWRRTLRQRSQKDWTTWERIKRLADDWLPNRESFIRARESLRR